MGYVTYVRAGKNLRASVNFSAPERKEVAMAVTDAEAIELFKSYNAYSGVIELGSTATAEGTPVTIKIDVNLNPAGLGTYARILRPRRNKADGYAQSLSDRFLRGRVRERAIIAN